MLSACIPTIPSRSRCTLRRRNIAGGVVIILALVLSCLTPSARAQIATEQTLVATTAAGLNGVIQASDGNFYGASFPNEPDLGGIYRITPAGAITEVYAFTAVSGSNNSTLTEGSDGNLYGMTSNGGANGVGTIFQLTLNGQFTVLHNLSSADGSGGANDSNVMPPLIEGADGNFYGTTSENGPGGLGTIFSITPSGNYSVLYSFTGSGTDVPQGEAPHGLVQGSDGDFYGIAGGGGANGDGTFYKITPSGNFTLLYSFTGAAFGSGALVAPTGPLVEAGDGNFYGMTEYDTMFKLTPAGDFTPLYAATDNDLITEGLTLGSDGNLYAAITLGDHAIGANCPYGCGTVFQLTPSGTFTTIYNFTDSADSGFPVGLLAQGSDGKLYVTTTGTSLGATFGGAPASPVVSGTIDSLALSPALPAPVQLSFSSGSNPVNPGTPVTLTWKVLNAFSTTMQQCAAFVQGGAAGAGTWTGLQTGTLANSVYSGSASITPTTDGTYTYALTCGGQESGFATLNVGNALSVATTALPSATVGASYSQTLSATGGTPPYTWVINSGSLPDGLLLNPSDGTIYGTPSQSETANIVVQATDSAATPATATGNLILTVQSGLSITNPSLPGGAVGSPYSQTLTATGGIAPYTWSVASGSLPAGLSLAAATGIISGTPTAAGSSTFSVEVTDAEETPATSTVSFSLQVVSSVGSNVTLTTSLNPSESGQSVTFTARLSTTPASAVSFLDGTTLMGTSAANAQVATFETSALTVGNHAITSSYTPLGSSTTVVSNVVTQVVDAVPASFSITAANSGNIAVSGGSSETLALTMTATGGYTGTVNYSCTPSSATFTCSVAPTSVSFTSGGATTQTSMLTINAFLTTGSDLKQPAKPFQNSTSIPIYAAMALWLPGSFLGLVGIRRKGRGKHMRKILMLVLLCAGVFSAASLTGCSSIQKGINCAENGGSNCSNGTTNTPAGSYTVAVTSSDGKINSNLTVNVTVQ